MDKIYLRSDGAINTGRKIIDYLISLGGENTSNLIGTAALSEDGGGSFYYIDSTNKITYGYIAPEGYTPIDINHIFDINMPNFATVGVSKVG